METGWENLREQLERPLDATVGSQIKLIADNSGVVGAFLYGKLGVVRASVNWQ